jgi:hypothetical protein
VQFISMEGFPIRKTPITNPYDFDEYVIWKKASGNVIGYLNPRQALSSHKMQYSDRLFQKNPDWFNVCSMEIWGNTSQNFDGRNVKEIEEFLMLYLCAIHTEFEFIAITKMCNLGNGYPIWGFYYREEKY